MKTAKNTFKTLLNLPLSEQVTVEGSFETPEVSMQLDELLKVALEKRPEVTQSKLNEQAGEKPTESK